MFFMVIENKGSRVLESLNRIKSKPLPQPKPKIPSFSLNEGREPRIEAENTFVMNVEKSLRKVEELDAKMKKDSSNYLSLYWEFVEAEKKFIDAVQAMEERKLRVPENFMRRIEHRKQMINERKTRASTQGTTDKKF